MASTRNGISAALLMALIGFGILAASPLKSQASVETPDGSAFSIDTRTTGNTFLQIDERYPVSESLLAAIETLEGDAFQRGFSGQIALSLGGFSVVNTVSPDLAREGYNPPEGEELFWPLASLTKQRLAWQMAQELDAGGLPLDTKISEFVPQITRDQPIPSIRQLLQHRSGLRNPNDTPVGPDGWPEFYTQSEKYGLEWCLKGRSAPPAEGWSYNNCDYIVLGAAFEELRYETVEYMLAISPQTSCPEGEECKKVIRTRFVTPATVDTFFAMRSPEREALPGYGASGALGAPLLDVAAFNDSIMEGYQTAQGATREFWQGNSALGYMALGHWVFTVQPEGCDAPVKVSQRKGGIGQYRLENIMLPELRRSMVFATIDPDFEFGEIWTGDGFLRKAVAALACGDTD